MPPLKYQLFIERPKEDLIYAILRRINSGMTNKLGQSTPLGQLIVNIVIAITSFFLVIAVAI
jgi:fluoride ion exporter CrcB/FEX